MQKLLLISAASVLTLDQVTKYLVVFYMNLIERGQISVWPGFIHFHMAWNSGINFGLFSDNGLATRWILIAIALGICGVVTYWMRRETRPIALISAGIVIGGALGNAIDRVYMAVSQIFSTSPAVGCKIPSRSMLPISQYLPVS